MNAPDGISFGDMGGGGDAISILGGGGGVGGIGVSGGGGGVGGIGVSGGGGSVSLLDLQQAHPISTNLIVNCYVTVLP